MNKINCDAVMQNIIGELKGEKKRLLLHSCCAPCSTACIERLKDFFDITVYYYNPNIDGKKEFDLRAEEQKRLRNSKRRMKPFCYYASKRKNKYYVFEKY